MSTGPDHRVELGSELSFERHLVFSGDRPGIVLLAFQNGGSNPKVGLTSCGRRVARTGAE
jgi:hypothetical protein